LLSIRFFVASRHAKWLKTPVSQAFDRQRTMPKVAGGQKKRHNSMLLSIKRRQDSSAGV